MPLLDRTAHISEIERRLARSPVVALLGPRQAGKTTLAKQVASRWRRGGVTTFDLEHQRDVERLEEPSRALAPLRGLVIIDEVQRRPELFPALRVLADRARSPARFLVLGSASPHLLKQTSESLAGRITYHELTGFSLDEVGAPKLQRLWLRGGFPPSYTARSAADSSEWRRDFIRTFLERDLPQLDIRTPSAALGRFWQMLAHVHGQTLNWSELGRSMGVADNTVRSYVDILEATFMVQTLKPWHENISKRQVKAPKLYFRDSGILHTQLDLEEMSKLQVHPRVGASWEGFIIQQIVQVTGARSDQCYFWRTQAGAELDLLIVSPKARRGFEVKFTEAPGVTPSMRTARDDLKLDSLDVIHAGNETYPLSDRIRAVAAERLLTDLAP